MRAGGLTVPPVRCLKCFLDLVQDALCLVQDFEVPEAKGAKPEGRQSRCSRLICVHLKGMLTSVDFNDQGFVHAQEVDDVWPDRLLAPKLEAVQSAIAQMPPEPLFGLRCVPSQVSGAL